MTAEREAKRHPVRTLLLLAVVVAVVWGILEGGGRHVTRQREESLLRASPHLNWTSLHQYDPDLMWALKANVKDGDQGFPFGGSVVVWKVNTNELGLRTPPLHEPKSRYRILVVGDSRTYGMGVNDGETWPARMQALLDQAEPNRYEVINAAVTGYTSVQGLNYLRLRGLSLNPDVVVVVYGYNEGAPVPPPGIGDWYWQNPQADSGFKTLVKRAIRGAGLGSGDPVSYPNVRVSSGRLFDTLIEMNRICQSRNVPVVYVSWPSYLELIGEPYDRPFYSTLVAEAAKQANAPCISVAESLASATGPIFVDDIHLNADGCLRVAEKIGADFQTLLKAGMNPGVLASPAPLTGPPKEPGAAADFFQRMFCLNPNFAQVCSRLNDTLLALNDGEKRAAVWRELSEQFPQAGQPRGYLAQALEATGNLDEAAAAYLRAVELNPHDISQLLGTTDALLRINKPAGLTVTIAGILSNNPSPEIWPMVKEKARKAQAAGVPWKQVDEKIRKDVTLPTALIADLAREWGG